MYKNQWMMVGSMGCRGITPTSQEKLLPAEPQGTCGTPYTFTINNVFHNSYNYFDFMERKDLTKPGGEAGG